VARVRVARGTGQWARERHVQELKAQRKDRWSPPCLGVRVQRRADVACRVTSRTWVRSGAVSFRFSLV
jgi:hypothetical protein